MKNLIPAMPLALLLLTGCVGDGDGAGGWFQGVKPPEPNDVTGADGCPPYAHLEGDKCVCDEDFAVGDDNLSCVRVSCPPRMHPEGNKCSCDPIYQLGSDGQTCIPLGASVPLGDGPLLVAEESLEIKGDSNGDGLLNPGETAKVYFDLVNASEETLDETIRGLISSTSPYVTWKAAYGADFAADPVEVSFQSCPPGDLCQLVDYYVHLAVRPDTPVGAEIPLRIHDLKGGLGEFYADTSFSLTVWEAGGALGVAEESVEVKNDSNADGLANPGETMKIYFDLENIGTATVNGPIVALLSVDSAHATWKAAYGSADASAEPIEVSFQGCDPGDLCDLDDYYFHLSLSPELSVGAAVAVSLSGLTDGLGQVHPDLQFVLPVVEAGGALGVAAESVSVQGDTDGDGLAEPGESMKVYFDLENTGTARLNEPITALLSSASPYATWKKANTGELGVEPIEVTFGGCEPGDLCDLYDYYFHLTLGPDAPVGAGIVFALVDLVDGQGQSHPALELSLGVE